MAVKKNSKTTTTNTVTTKTTVSWMSFGWVILLIGGLAHMLPEQMGPIVKLAVWGMSVQTVVGILSVILALYFLLGEE